MYRMYSTLASSAAASHSTVHVRPSRVSAGVRTLFSAARRGFSSRNPGAGAEDGLSHVDRDTNQPTMVDISDKTVTTRWARAQAIVLLPDHVADLLREDGELIAAKGPVIATAIVAGTMAVKKTSDLIPFCHPLPLDSCKFSVKLRSHDEALPLEMVRSLRTDSLPQLKDAAASVAPSQHGVRALYIHCDVRVTHKTGVEMEALTGASVCALTVYDMVKALSHDLVVRDLRLLGKTGGKSAYVSTSAVSRGDHDTVPG